MVEFGSCTTEQAYSRNDIMYEQLPLAQEGEDKRGTFFSCGFAATFASALPASAMSAPEPFVTTCFAQQRGTNLVFTN